MLARPGQPIASEQEPRINVKLITEYVRWYSPEVVD
jgi:hypothetical protein